MDGMRSEKCQRHLVDSQMFFCIECESEWDDEQRKLVKKVAAKETKRIYKKKEEEKNNIYVC